ncbi:anti-sigma factor family protein [Desulfonema magnum]|uniref:Zinc finger domain-containing protein n=1 Tax=Desulfonema magnum TaxID=45655 RepID=A0A975GLD8_9BACT|nr:anti-sigma factor [Desulfonema magnum]QTA85544.1 Zinc finger domain-containing protein [Desulfonema magnum]
MKLQCIDMDVLADYISGDLSDRERNQTEKHLAACDECLEEFVLARTLLDDSELAEYEPGPMELVRSLLQEVGDTLKKKFSEWIRGLAPPEWIPHYEPSPVRSGAMSDVGSMLVKKEINELQTELYVEKEANDTARIWVKVAKNNNVAKNVCLTLIRDGKFPFGQILKRDREYVLFDRQPFGNYSLMLEQDAVEKGGYSFEITDAGFYEK